MRPALLARVLLLAAMTALFTRGALLPSAQARGGARKETNTIVFTVNVQSDIKATKERALEDALQEAGKKIAEYFNSHNVPYTSIPNDYIRQHFLGDVDEPSAKEKEAGWNKEEVNGHWILAKQQDVKLEDLEKGDLVDTAYTVRLTVNVSNQDIRQYQDQFRGEVVHQRQLWLGEILLGAVVLLGTIALYMRLEDATKGYYTAWLRLGLVGIVCAVGALLFFVVA
jgi:hypothetical protein